MRTRESAAALVLALLGVVGEWVPVAVIDRGPEVRRPQGHLSVPQGHLPASQEHPPAPQGHLPAPQEHPPAPQGHLPASQEHPPAPQGHLSASQEHPPAPQGHLPAPQGHLPASQEHPHAPQGHLPPPQEPLGPKGPQEPPGPQDRYEYPSQTTVPPAPSPLPALDPIGPPGPGPLDDVITIRRTVGDSFSNKKGVVVPSSPGHGDPGGATQQHGEDDGVHVEDAAEVREDAVDGPQGPPGASAAGREPAEDAAGGLPLEELREAHRALLRQSTAPVSGKLDFLRRLKNRLLRHIASLMPQTALTLAAAPGDAMEGRGHKGLGFPSNEGTLMSLAFLVFAVFLVKVVLQLIYAVQNSQASTAAAGVRVAQMQIPSPVIPAGVGSMMGTMMNMVPAMMPPMMAAMEPAMAMRGRARREADSDRRGDRDGLHRITVNVMEAIDRARGRLAAAGMRGG